MRGTSLDGYARRAMNEEVAFERVPYVYECDTADTGEILKRPEYHSEMDQLAHSGLRRPDKCLDHHSFLPILRWLLHVGLGDREVAEVRFMKLDEIENRLKNLRRHCETCKKRFERYCLECDIFKLISYYEGVIMYWRDC